VARLQFEVARHGFPNGDEDGVFGPHALVGVQRFQAWAGLAADGAVGPSTRRALATPPPQSPLKFYRPLHVALGDPFGPRGAGFHPGIDLPAPTGTPVGAAGRGCVTFAGYDPSGYGNLVVIGHRLGVTSMYAHLSEIDVRVGQCLVGHDTQ
jgi:murein DD-endopeptidase MepM/ murein hydrolase activator NlpD